MPQPVAPLSTGRAVPVLARPPLVLTAACGVVGTVTLIGSFVINPAAPASLTTAQLGGWAVQHHTTIVLGGWLQGIGSLLTVLFALALVHLAGAAHRFAGWATLLAGGAILLVSLVEITFYLAAAEAAVTGDVATGTISNALITAVQHVFLIAPALLLLLGAVLLGSRVLPRGFAYLALALGAIRHLAARDRRAARRSRELVPGRGHHALVVRAIHGRRGEPPGRRRRRAGVARTVAGRCLHETPPGVAAHAIADVFVHPPRRMVDRPAARPRFRADAGNRLRRPRAH